MFPNDNRKKQYKIVKRFLLWKKKLPVVHKDNTRKKHESHR